MAVTCVGGRHIDTQGHSCHRVERIQTRHLNAHGPPHLLPPWHRQRIRLFLDRQPGGLGGDADTDGDGVPDVMDMCPTQMEVWNRYYDYDGCPDTVPTGKSTIDTDGDTIVDSADMCPNEKETWNKYFDEDGCPDIAPEQSRYKHDADLDNIINDEDMCPAAPEDYDGDRDTDGCPDP